MDKERYVPLRDWSRLKLFGFPWQKSYVYKLIHRKEYPQLFLKIGGVVVVDLNALEKIISSASCSTRENVPEKEEPNTCGLS